uniref:Uncharacterized protein n=1 Tax=Anguilla anguilla TaxID=7936 RepID=A0A0E9TLN3_ANGAN
MNPKAENKKLDSKKYTRESTQAQQSLGSKEHDPKNL